MDDDYFCPNVNGLTARNFQFTLKNGDDFQFLICIPCAAFFTKLYLKLFAVQASKWDMVRALNGSEHALTATLGVKRDWPTQKTQGVCECALILNLPADWLGRFWQSERTEVVLGVHC